MIPRPSYHYLLRYSTLLLILTTFSLSSMTSQAPFRTTWETGNPGTSSSTSITIPTTGTGYLYDVDWDDDGVYDDIGVMGSITHDYGTSGKKKVRIRGTFPRIYFNNGGDKLKLLSIDSWGDIEWQSMSSAFDGCANLIDNTPSGDTPDLSSATSMSEMFIRCTTFVGDLSDWDVSNVVFMVSTFNEASSFNSDISSWDVSNVQTMGFMFREATAFNQDISGWHLSSLENIRHAFQRATSFDQDLGDWDIDTVEDMTDALDDVGMSRSNYDKTLIGWAAQSGLQSGITLGAANLTYCHASPARRVLTSPPHNWNINGDTEDCTDATFQLLIRTDNPGVSGSTSFTIPTSTAAGTYRYDVDWEGDGTFDELDLTGNATHDYGASGFYIVTIRGDFPQIAFGPSSTDSEKVINIAQWGEIEWKSMSRAFNNCKNMLYTATDVPDLSKVQDLSAMFFGCSLFNGAIDDWDVSQVKTINSIFDGCTVFNQPLASWDVSNVTNMAGAFGGASVFDQDISDWEVDSVQNFSFLFTNAEAFNQDIGG